MISYIKNIKSKKIFIILVVLVVVVVVSFILLRQNKLTQQYRISNTNGHRKGKKRQNDQRCNMLARVKLEDEGISRHGRNTRLI